MIAYLNRVISGLFLLSKSDSVQVLKLGNPILRQQARNVSIDEMTSPEMQKFIQTLTTTMREQKGVGIAAPQIGKSVRLFLVEIETTNPRYDIAEPFPLTVVFNPVIRITDPTPVGFWEGCLSVPGLRGYVTRPQAIEVDFFDKNGEKVNRKLDGMPARVFLHENDHLDGELFVNRIDDTKKHLISLGEYNKREKDN